MKLIDQDFRPALEKRTCFIP